MLKAEMVKNRAILAGLWSAVEQIGGTGVSTLFVLVFARHLDASDYGVFAAAAMVTGFGSLIAKFGLDSFIIQKPELNETVLSTAFWISLGAAVTVALILITLSIPLASLFGDPTIALLLPVLAVGMVVTTASAMVTALVRRDLNMKALARRTLLANTMSGLIATPFVFNGFGAWGLVIQAVGGAVFTLLLTIFFVGWPVRRTFDSVSAREMLGVGREILGAELLTRYNKESPKIFIGLFMGVDALGIFAMAMRFVSLLHQLVGGTLHKVTLPVFSQVNRASPDRMSEVYLRLIRLGAAVIFPSYFLIIVMADPLVAVLLGPNWADIVPVIGVLVLGAMLINFGALDSSTLVSMGNTKSPFLYSLIRAIFGSLLMITAAPFGVVAIGVAYCLRGVFVEPFQNNRLLQLLNVPLAVYLKQLWRSFLSALAMAAIGTCLLSVFDGKHEVLVLGLSMTIALVGYVGFLFTFDKPFINELRSLINL